MVTIEEVWARIVKHKGAEFHTKTALPFTYEIQGNVFRPIRDHQINRKIPKSDFEEALKHVPCDGLGDMDQSIHKGHRSIQGSSYVWAVLHDPRIRL